MKKISVFLSILLCLAMVLPADADVKSLSAAAVAAQSGGYLSMLNSYNIAFSKMDTGIFSTMQERLDFRETGSEDEADYSYFLGMWSDDTEKGVWAMPYVGTETIDFGKGIKADNNIYGIFGGMDIAMFELETFDLMLGIYAGYNGSDQSYDGNKITQNAGNIGIMGMIYKNDLFIGAAINYGMGSVNVSADTEDSFNLSAVGIAAKVGYNKDLNENGLILQPFLEMSYTYVNTEDYKTGDNIQISGDSLGVFNVEPGIKLIMNCENNLSPYVCVSGVFNINDETTFKADNESLPGLKTEPYVKYGFGISSKADKNIMFYVESFFTSGSRNGGELSAGLKFRFGKANAR